MKPENEESEDERVDRELSELLEELRVAIPGIQVLFAFLLGVAFTDAFRKGDSLQHGVYFATLLTTAAAAALLIAPSAHHRLHFRSGDKERILFIATRQAIGGLLLMLLAVAGSVFLVGDVIYMARWAAIAAAGTALWIGWFWFGLPLSERRRAKRV